MKSVTKKDLEGLYVPPIGSHKGQNGRLLVIGGSHLFHAASVWALTVASRIVDLVHYSSISENNEIVQKTKEDFRNGIVVPRQNIEDYLLEDDAVLIGPGMTRDAETEKLTHTLLHKYPQKQWVIDAGALQMLHPEDIPPNAILTPHHKEWERLSSGDQQEFAKKYQCIVLVKGKEDIACSFSECRMIAGGNAGMTKGGTGDVLAGLISALACKNNPFLATIAGSFINKKAGDTLYENVGPFFNATDLANQIPKTMKEFLEN